MRRGVGRQRAGLAVGHPPGRRLRRGADARRHDRVALGDAAVLARGQGETQLRLVGARGRIRPHIPPPRARRQQDVARAAAHRVGDPQREPRDGERPLTQALGQLLHRGRAHVPVREEPLGVPHQEADAVQAVGLGEEEALFLEEPGRQVPGGVLRGADRVFLAQAGLGARWLLGLDGLRGPGGRPTRGGLGTRSRRPARRGSRPARGRGWRHCLCLSQGRGLRPRTRRRGASGPRRSLARSFAARVLGRRPGRGRLATAPARRLRPRPRGALRRGTPARLLVGHGPGV